ncbi:hypothetical protein [Streptomyces sp. NPDC058579]
MPMTLPVPIEVRLPEGRLAVVPLNAFGAVRTVRPDTGAGA